MAPCPSKDSRLRHRSKVAPHPRVIYHSIRLCTRNPNHFTESELDHWEPRYELSLNFIGGHFIFWEFFDFLWFSSEWKVKILISYFPHMQLSMLNPNKQVPLDDSEIFSFYNFCHAKFRDFWLGRAGFSCYFQHFTKNHGKSRERGPIIFAKESPNHIGWTPEVTIQKWIKLFY